MLIQVHLQTLLMEQVAVEQAVRVIQDQQEKVVVMEQQLQLQDHLLQELAVEVVLMVDQEDLVVEEVHLQDQEVQELQILDQAEERDQEMFLQELILQEVVVLV